MKIYDCTYKGKFMYNNLDFRENTYKNITFILI